MGAVYRAVDVDSGALVAVKLVRNQPGAVGPARRFRREFSAVARLRHPNIVAVYRYGACADGEYIVMEWVPGGDLWHVAGRRARKEDEPRQLPAQWVAPVIAVAAQVCDAMSYLHAHRILHRDLKPENILVDGAGRARLVDFGIAKPLALDPVAPLTAVGETVGTARYMSPEQARSLDLDGRADLYSLGVILFEMISGRPPFTAPSLFDLLMAHVTEPAPRLADYAPHIPPSLCAVVNRLLEKDRSSRYPDAGSLRDELLAHLSPDVTLQAPGAAQADMRDLPLAVAAALEAAGRAEEVRKMTAEARGRGMVLPGGRVPTPDPTNANILVEHRPPPIRSWFTRTPPPEAAQTRPFQVDDAAAAHTPNAGVRPGQEVAPDQMLFPKAEDALEMSDIAELFAPAFRGRDHLVNSCLSGYRNTLDRPAVRWFKGVQGSGRTRLLAEIRDLLRFEMGAMVLTARGQDPAVGMSAARMFFQSMPKMLARRRPDKVLEALGPSAALAVDLAPGLAELFAPVGQPEPPPNDPGSLRVLYYQAAERLIAMVADSNPVVLLLDDAERLDPDSLDLLRYLATPPPDESPSRGRPRLIAIAGDGEVAPWAGEGTEIPTLLGADIAVTLQTALGWTVPPTRLARRAVQERFHETPRRLLEWVRSLLLEAGRSSGREATEDDLLAVASGDPRLRWKARMRGLGGVALEAVGILGLVNRPVVLEWLLVAGDWVEDEFIEAINSLVRRGLVSERPAGETWGLELIDREAGDVAWEMIPEAQRQAAASAFATRVEAEHPDHPAALDERPALAARAYLRAGLEGTALPLLEAATRHEQAAGRTATGLAMADLWVETAGHTGDDDLRDALDMRVQLACSACEWHRAEADLEQLEQLAGDDPQARLRVLTARAGMCEQSQDHEGVIDSVEEAFRVALEVDAPLESLFELSHLVANVDMRAGSLVAARDRWLGIAAQARTTVNAYWEMLARASAALADRHLGEFSASEHGFRQARQLAEDQCDELTGLRIDLHMAALTTLRGDAEAGLAEVISVADRARELGALRVLGRAITEQGEVSRRLGRLEDAELYLERGERILRNTEQRVTLGLCLAERSLTALQRGDLEAAQNHAASAGMAASLSPGVLLEQERVHFALGRVAEVRGDRVALAAARRAAVDALQKQARYLGPEHLGRWVAVATRLEVVTWADWRPSGGRG